MKGLAILLVAVTLGERGLGDVLQEVVTCDEKSDGEPAARLAMQHINKHHHHGYKFKLSKLRSFRTEKVSDKLWGVCVCASVWGVMICVLCSFALRNRRDLGACCTWAWTSRRPLVTCSTPNPLRSVRSE